MQLLVSFDNAVAQALFSIRDMNVVYGFIGISELGEDMTIAGISVIIVLLFLLRRRFHLAVGIAVSVFGSMGAVYFLKDLFHRARPGEDVAAYLESSFSFPSGHATFSIALYGFIIWLLLRNKRSFRRDIAIALLSVLIVLISFTRLYLGVHYVTDVLGGLIIGGIFLSLGIRATKLLERRSAAVVPTV